MGDVTLILDNTCHLELKECPYILEYRKNFVLVSSIIDMIIQFISIKVFLLERIIYLFAQVHLLTVFIIYLIVLSYYDKYTNDYGYTLNMTYDEL